MKIGCHISIAGGIENAPKRARGLGAECFQIFTRSPHGGNHHQIDEKTARKFLTECEKNQINPQDCLVHTPYFINLASTNHRIYYGSINSIRTELEAASLLKIPFVVTHIGSGKDLEGEDIQKQINEKVSKALTKIHENYQNSAMLLLEIAAGSGNIIGDDFEEIGFFIKEAKKENIKIGFCFDTCHAFAAGFDLRTPEKVREVFQEIDQKIGLEYLKAIHFNDSMTEFASKKDRHEHIGKGKIGAEGLKEVFKIAQELSLNLHLETKHDTIEADLGLVKNWRDELR